MYTLRDGQIVSCEDLACIARMEVRRVVGQDNADEWGGTKCSSLEVSSPSQS